MGDEDRGALIARDRDSRVDGPQPFLGPGTGPGGMVDDRPVYTLSPFSHLEPSLSMRCEDVSLPVNPRRCF